MNDVQVFESLESFAEARLQAGLALGVFDGMHLGHQAVIDAARGERELGLLTFEPHPVQVLAPARTPRRIVTSFEHQKKILASLGVDFMVVLPFTPEFAEREGCEFAEQLFATGVKRVAAGRDWQFGKARSGNMSHLAEWGRSAGVEVLAVDGVMHGGERISSTRIRARLAAGDLAQSARLLGRPYSLFGKVKKGQQLGRTLGFPTANVALQREPLLPNGVYLVEGNGIRGVANLGTRPSIQSSSERSLEVHLFSDEIPMEYGWEMEVEFLRKIRDEIKFSGVEELKEQITEDVRNAREES